MSTISIENGMIANLPCSWVKPKHTDKKKLVIFLPGFSGYKSSDGEFLCILAEHGFHALSFDPYQHGDRKIETQEQLFARIHTNIRMHFWKILGKTVEDIPRIIDEATKTFNLNKEEVGLGGVSMGGDISIAAAGVDKRIKVISANIATPDWLRPGTNQVNETGYPDAESTALFAKYNPMNNLQNYKHCPSLQINCGEDDEMVPAMSSQVFESALYKTYEHCSDNLNINVNSGVGHQFNDEMKTTCLNWFIEKL